MRRRSARRLPLRCVPVKRPSCPLPPSATLCRARAGTTVAMPAVGGSSVRRSFRGTARPRPSPDGRTRTVPRDSRRRGTTDALAGPVRQSICSDSFSAVSWEIPSALLYRASSRSGASSSNPWRGRAPAIFSGVTPPRPPRRAAPRSSAGGRSATSSRRTSFGLSSRSTRCRGLAAANGSARLVLEHEPTAVACTTLPSSIVDVQPHDLADAEIAEGLRCGFHGRSSPPPPTRWDWCHHLGDPIDAVGHGVLLVAGRRLPEPAQAIANASRRRPGLALGRTLQR